MTGGIELVRENRWWVSHAGSLAVVVDVVENAETQAATCDLIDTLCQGLERLVVVDFPMARILTFDLDDIRERIEKP